MNSTMREILFRGKRIEDGEWIYGGYSHCEKDNTDFITVMGKDRISHIGCHQQIQPETRGLYTDLTDKNGKKIFEGDIIQNSLGAVYVVEWDNMDLCFVFNCYKGETSNIVRPWLVTYEVIGNIHDNPELLGGDSNDSVPL